MRSAVVAPAMACQPSPGAVSSITMSAHARARAASSAAARSMGSMSGRTPGVSNQSTTRPARSMRAATASRVVPGVWCAMATARPASALSSVLLPALVGPVTTTRAGVIRRRSRRSRGDGSDTVVAVKSGLVCKRQRAGCTDSRSTASGLAARASVLSMAHSMRSAASGHAACADS